MASIDTQRTKPAAKSASGRAGPLRPRTEKTASEGHGQDTHMSGDERQGVAEKLGRLWNTNCQVEAAVGVNLTVHFRLGSDGRLSGLPTMADGSDPTKIENPILAAAAARAISAVGRAQPYTDVINPAHLNQTNDFNVTFNAKRACSQK